jgi:hypothetical protein
MMDKIQFGLPDAPSVVEDAKCPVLGAVHDSNRWQMHLEQNHFEYEAGGVLTEWLAAIYDISPRPISKSTGRKIRNPDEAVS